MDAALHAHFGGAARPCLGDAARDLAVVKVVGRAAQVGVLPPFREGAKTARVVADVGVVDIAVDRIAHSVAASGAAHGICGGAHCFDFVAARGEETRDFAFAQAFTGAGAGEQPVESRGPDACRRGKRRRCAGGAGTPGIGAREPGAIHAVEHVRHQRPIVPARRVEAIRRIARQALDQDLAGLCGAFAQRGDVRPRRFRVHVVGRHRRDTAPVVDAGGNQVRVVGGAQVGRRLDVHRRAEREARQCHRPCEVRAFGLAGTRHRRTGFGAEILDDDFLDVTVAQVQFAQGQQRIEALFAGLADADQDAAGERHRQLAGQANRFKPHCGMLVRRAVMRPAAFGQARRRALQHDALRGTGAA